MAQPRLPDVNAMMQTRTAGMENIYAIEQQRAAQAQTAQKEQEAALVEALTPAYAIAFKGGGTKEALTAAFGVLSPEFQAAIKPQFDKIMALPSDDLRMSALETSLVGSEPGRAIHASIPTAMQKLNAEIQRGQLEVSKQRLALDVAAANQPPQVSPDKAAELKYKREKDAADRAATGRNETAAEVKARLDNEKRAKDIDFAVEQVERSLKEGGLLDQATGSTIGAMVDTVAQTVGYGTEGAIANARMKPIADLVLKLVPRFEGPQAIPDVQSYKEASGDMANPNLPTSVKRAAANEIIRLLKAYPGQFEYAGGGNGGGGGDGAADTGVLEYDADGNLIE
jgi:hypothetical protein